jgi:uncharacterized membrane protein YebE (DUF533 family)
MLASFDVGALIGQAAGNSWGAALPRSSAAKFLDQEFSQPASVLALVREASTPATAMQVYTAARLAVVPDQPDEQRFLARLAEGLKLEPSLVSHIDAATRCQ